MAPILTAVGVPVSIRHVSFRHKGAEDGRLALDDVCIDVPAGQVVVLCGRSGCGKTTVTRLVNGLIPHFCEGDLWGEVSVGGIDPSVVPITETAACVGSVFQNPRSQFFNVDTTSELAFACENMGWDRASYRLRPRRCCGAVRSPAPAESKPFPIVRWRKAEDSMCERLGALPRVMVLDEPASNLDMGAIRMLSDIIAEWKAEGRTVIVAEHRLGYLVDVADRFVLLESGRVAWDRTSEQVASMSDGELHRFGLRSVLPVRFCRQSQTPDSGEPDDAVGISGIEIRKMRFAHKSDGGPLDSIGGAGRDGLASSLEGQGRRR